MKVAGRALQVAALLGILTSNVVSRKESLDSTHSVTPVAKALEMLRSMQQKGEDDMQAEEVSLSSFNQWCESKAVHKQNEIDEGEEKKEKLESDVETAESELLELQRDVDRENSQVAKYDEERTAAIDVRNEESADYEASNKELAASLSALDNAISVLKEQADKKVVGDSLLQVQNQTLVPSEEKAAIADFVHAPGDRNAYEGESGGVVEMLQKLKDEFSQQLADLQSEETKARQAHELMLNQLKHQSDTAAQAIEKKLGAQGSIGQAKSEAEDDLAEATNELAEDQQYLKDMKTMCATKAADYEKRKVIRQKELKAIVTAIKVLEEKVAVLIQLGQTKDGSSLALLRSGGFRSRLQRSRDLQTSLVQFLQQRGSTLNSVALSMLSERAAVDPLQNVKGMIKDMIFKLQEQVTAETDKKAFCDSELGENKFTREKKAEDAENFKLEIEDLESQLGQLAADIKALKGFVSEFDGDIAETTAARKDAKAKNDQTIKDAVQAQAAVEEAILALREFYGSSGDTGGGVFLQAANSEASVQPQGPAADAPETFADTDYAGMGQGGVIEMLEIAETQYASLKAETEETERLEDAEFKTFLGESEKEKALKTNELRHKEDKKTRKEQTLRQTNAELEEAMGQLEKANAYFEKLKPECLAPPMSYEERKQKREEEINALSEALELLSDEEGA